MNCRNLFTALLEGAVALSAYAQTPNRSPGFTVQGPAHYSFMVGDVRVTALSDGTVPQDLHALLRNTTNEKPDVLLRRSFLSNPVEASINAFLFRTGDRLVLVDTGAGQFFGPGFGGKLLLSLASIGLTPDNVTDVLLTHAHDDHMGGLVHDGEPTFPNAIVHLSNAGHVFRARLIVMLAEGASYASIKLLLRTTAPTISRWKQRWPPAWTAWTRLIQDRSRRCSQPGCGRGFWLLHASLPRMSRQTGAAASSELLWQ